MNAKDKKKGSESKIPTNGGNGTEAVLKIFVISIGVTATLLLFPSLSNLPVFSRGEFAYLESVGIIFACLTLILTLLIIFSKAFFKTGIKKGVFKYIFFAGSIGVSVLFVMMVVGVIWIRFYVKVNCEMARIEYGGSCREALSSQLEDVDRGFRSRNDAIWTLGQLADRSSLSVLRKYYTGNIPEREPLNGSISQYELKKAITWCEKGNVTSWMYKGL